MHKEQSELIGSAEVSQILQIDRSTVSRWVKAGKLKPAIKGSGIRGELFFRRNEIESSDHDSQRISA